MQILVCVLSSFVLLFLYLLTRSGRHLRRMQQEETLALSQASVISWPKLVLIVPVAGNDPRVHGALLSLLAQEYEPLYPVFVTETAHEPAARLIEDLKGRYPRLRHVVAGPSVRCGQKNHNLLAAIEATKDLAPDCYAFCDSTHIADPRFLQYLVHPIARGRAVVATGYHEIVPKASQEEAGSVSWAYVASVLIMRLLQGLSAFTQPWGGALAIQRNAFERYGVAELWGKTVVDDCALVTHLQKQNCKVALVANALLRTEVHNHKRTVWEQWMERQILFPRFCVPLQWGLLGLLLLLFFMPPLIWIEEIWLSISRGMYLALLAPTLWVGCFFLLVLQLRRFIARPVGAWTWCKAFLQALTTFAQVYIGTIGSRSIVWADKEYRVGRGGLVLEKRERKKTS